jgi:Peptidase A4 family
MFATRIWALAVALGALAPLSGIGTLGAVEVATSPLPISLTTDSTNWAGWAVTGPTGSVSQVTGSWIQPAVTCSLAPTYAAFWDGIDGYTSSSVEQGGTLAYCSLGSAYYYAWYEFYPAASVEINSLTVHPGDKISVTVSFNSTTSRFAIVVKDGSSSYTETGTVSGASRSSAECIAERPQVDGTISSLADFGTAKFGVDSTSTIGCAATISGTAGAFGSFSTRVPINMVDEIGMPLATTSALSSDGTSFTETWDASN